MPSPIRLIKNCLFKAVIWLGRGKKNLNCQSCFADRASEWPICIYFGCRFFVLFFVFFCSIWEHWCFWRKAWFIFFWMALWLCFWNNNPLCFILDGLLLISLKTWRLPSHCRHLGWAIFACGWWTALAFRPDPAQSGASFLSRIWIRGAPAIRCPTPVKEGEISWHLKPVNLCPF